MSCSCWLGLFERWTPEKRKKKMGMYTVFFFFGCCIVVMWYIFCVLCVCYFIIIDFFFFFDYRFGDDEYVFCIISVRHIYNCTSSDDKINHNNFFFFILPDELHINRQTQQHENTGTNTTNNINERNAIRA